MTAGRRRACAAGRRRPVYSTLGVPEIWRYEVKRRRAVISVLRHGAYVEVANSRAFPMMTGDVIATFLEQSKTEGQRAALQAFAGRFARRAASNAPLLSRDTTF